MANTQRCLCGSRMTHCHASGGARDQLAQKRLHFFRHHQRSNLQPWRQDSGWWLSGPAATVTGGFQIRLNTVKTTIQSQAGTCPGRITCDFVMNDKNLMSCWDVCYLFYKFILRFITDKPCCLVSESSEIPKGS